MEAIESARYAHSDGMGAFMCFMAVRLMEMHRVLREDGSIYLHCDPTASHYLKACMDAVFGEKNFRNEIICGVALELPRLDGHLSIWANDGGVPWREERGDIRPSTGSN